LKAEEEVAASGIAFNIVRPSIVYGPGDQSGITPRLIMGAVYQKLDKKMECLWDKGLRLNTVHVRDVAKAIFLIATKAPEKEIYNLADSSDTDQGSVNAFIATLFGIKTDFMGAIQSSLATSLAMKTVADVANDKHLKPWSDLLKEQGIVDSPLTPYLDEELLYNNSYSLDGQKIVKNLGFVYDQPQLTIDLLVEVIHDFEAKKYFPKGLLKYTPK
jgi:nucleoside-diphosphate-sugar epimerase